MEQQEHKEKDLFVRNRYYPGKLLRAVDFEREQEYGNAKLAFVNRKFHGCGIIEGLEIQSRENGALYLTSGSAIDPRGRILVAPEDVRIEPERLEGFTAGDKKGFVLGIRYTESQTESERNHCSEKETFEKGRIVECTALQAYSVEEWKQLKTGEDMADLLTEKKILYEDEQLQLSLRLPKVVPEDSIFKIRMEAKALGEGSVRIGWRGTMKLQGAFFLSSGKSLQALGQEQTLVSGSLYREWEICTEEYRKQSVAMELSRLEIFLQGAEPVTAEVFQTHIDTITAYEDAVRRCLRKGKKLQPEGKKVRQKSDWIPLARLKPSADREGDVRAFLVAEEPQLRRYVMRTEEMEAIRRISEENGIMEIRWRGLLQRASSLQTPLQPLPIPPAPETPILPEPIPSPEPMPREAGAESLIHRGMTVIPIPKRYRRGDTLFSEEIEHGFPGEEVILWLDRMYEENNYAYWERHRTRYAAIHGADELFADGWESGWEIRKQAIRQDIEAGTFQIALVLSGARRKNRSKEVAVSWTAVRLPQPTKSS